MWDILPEVHDISMVAQTCDLALSSVLSHFCYQFIQVVRVFFHPALVVSLQHCLLTHLFEINFLCKILTIVHFVDLREPIYTERKRNFSLLSLSCASPLCECTLIPLLFFTSVLEFYLNHVGIAGKYLFNQRDWW